MRLFALALAVASVGCWLSPQLGLAQQAGGDVADSVAGQADAEPAKIETTYFVQLTTYHSNKKVEDAKSVSEIVALLTAGSDDAPKSIETIRFSAASGKQCMVQFGKQVTVPVGSVITGRGTTARQMQSMNVGTLARITATPQADKVSVTLEFEASRLTEGEDEDVSRPETIVTTIQTSQLVELGKPTLVGGISSDASTYTLLTLTEQ